MMMTPSTDKLDNLIARLEADWQAVTVSPGDGSVIVPATVVEDAPVDRRQARRLTPEEFAADLRLTVAGAAEVKPINLSATGVLTETTQRLCPGRTVDLFLRFNGVRRVVRARVVRCSVHAVSPRPLFRAALQFEDPCRLPECDK
jgi:hypothetical protein